MLITRDNVKRARLAFRAGVDQLHAHGLLQSAIAGERLQFKKGELVFTSPEGTKHVANEAGWSPPLASQFPIRQPRPVHRSRFGA